MAALRFYKIVLEGVSGLSFYIFIPKASRFDDMGLKGLKLGKL
jgi:hypothetical protein